MKGERDEQTDYHRAGHAAAVVGRWRNGGDGLLGFVSAESVSVRAPSAYIERPSEKG